MRISYATRGASHYPEKPSPLHSNSFKKKETPQGGDGTCKFWTIGETVNMFRTAGDHCADNAEDPRHTYQDPQKESFNSVNPHTT